MSTKMEVLQMAPATQNAIVFARLTDGQINPLTTTAGLLAQAVTNGNTLHYDERRNVERITNANGALQRGINAGIFTNANVAAADTVNGLTTLIRANNADIPNGYFSGTIVSE